MRRMFSVLVAFVLVVAFRSSLAATIRVPQDRPTIQAAIDAARSGDSILVAPGTYQERIKLRPGVIVRSDGDDSAGQEGLRRAELTVIDGGGNVGGERGKTPGVVMAEDSTLDGFTITNVGSYDDALWQRHYDSNGEELGDEEGAVQAEGTTPAISIRGTRCTVARCIVHHNGDVGIGILGVGIVRENGGSGENGAGTEQRLASGMPLVAENVVYRNMGGGIGAAEGADAIIRRNVCRENLRAGIGCRQANPLIVDNVCYGNVRAGIGCREGSRAVIRGNRCYHNRRAGIGIRMSDTAPVVESNECYENDMAGIGCRDKASPILRKNVCRKNKMAGIGCREEATPLIVDNACLDNAMAGIGLQGKAVATILRNRCLDNKLVAIGVTEESTAEIHGNEVSRTGGMPPLIAVKDRSTATIKDNRFKGGGVAAVLVQGRAIVSGNSFAGAGGKQGNAIWIWEGSTATVADNAIDGYRAAVNASRATVVVTGNTITNFQGTAILVTDSQKPAHVHGNTAESNDSAAKAVDVRGPAGIVAENLVRRVETH